MSEKFRAWDSIALSEAAKLGVEVCQRVEELCKGNQITPDELPSSLIPTDKLYLLALAYTNAYEKLIEYDLLRTGNIKSTKNIH